MGGHHASTAEDPQIIDPAETVTYQVFDQAGRLTQSIENYVSGGTGSDQNKTTNWTYNSDSNILTLTAVNATTGNQTTTCSYGITVAGGSTLNSLSPLHSVTYPDAGKVTTEYNRQGDVIQRTDQNGTVHQYLFDGLGRQTNDNIVNLPSGVDPTVLQIQWTYEIRGVIQNVTTYSAVTGGSVVNDVQRVYNGFRQLTTEYQEHSGAVNTGTSAKVQYSYANGSANTIRLTGITYPNGNLLTYSYGTSGAANDLLSRVQSLVFNSVDVADYAYLGLVAPVQVTYGQPQVQYNLATGSSPNLYAGLDAFGRVIANLWQNVSGTPVNMALLNYGYDQASNRLWRQDAVAGSANFDELYGYDGLYRLSQMQRGQLNSTQTAITSVTLDFQQNWMLDPTGNWGGFTEQATGGSVTLNQTRSANTVNEITGITNSVGTGWSQPGYDAAGNMTTMPQPGSPANKYTATIDAWNRLTQLVDPSTGNTVQQNQYDGRNFRVARVSYTAGSLSETRQYFYTRSWQAVEERISGTTPDRQYVWGLRYIDDLVLRDRSVSGGTLNEQMYALQDANWNMVAICDTSGTVQERYAYKPYGLCLFLNPSYGSRSASSYNWNALYMGRSLDSGTGLYDYRMRFYNPLLGTFIGRDPAESDLNLYRFVRSNPTIWTDPSGLVEVKTTKANPPNEHGGYCVEWEFKLEHPAPPGGGYIVQHITAYDSARGVHGAQADYYEAWYVPEGATSPTTAWKGYTDRAIHDPNQNVPGGNMSQTGEIRFYPASDTGDLGDPGLRDAQGNSTPKLPDPKTGFGGEGQSTHVGYSGILPSTKTKPGFWKQLPPKNGEAPCKRKVEVKWGPAYRNSGGGVLVVTPEKGPSATAPESK